MNYADINELEIAIWNFNLRIIRTIRARRNEVEAGSCYSHRPLTPLRTAAVQFHLCLDLDRRTRLAYGSAQGQIENL
jgi:hypothetical protein